ncbi:MAG: hypothetical protein IPK65_06660 [Gammaproteobacteria bacterium]|nr:hypothetical protein [Gammaproteobacteria bacterium]
MQVRRLFDTVWVTGVMKVELTSSGLSETGYTLNALKSEPYKKLNSDRPAARSRNVVPIQSRSDKGRSDMSLRGFPAWRACILSAATAAIVGGPRPHIADGAPPCVDRC